jgi:hypothetical protein
LICEKGIMNPGKAGISFSGGKRGGFGGELVGRG